MKIAGYLFIGLGILDFLLSWMGVDISASEEMVLVNYGQNCTPDPARM